MNNNSSKPSCSQCLPDNGAEEEMKKIIPCKETKTAIEKFPNSSHDHELFKQLVSAFYPEPKDLHRLLKEYKVPKNHID